MSEYMFGVSTVRLTEEQREQLDVIASRHGASLTEMVDPGSGYKRWFSCRGYGHPFDRATAEAVYSDMRAAGLDEESLERDAATEDEDE